MATTDDARVKRRSDWRLPEVGTVLGIRFLVALATIFGRTAVTAFLWVLAAYYALASSRVRRASKAYLERVGERPELSAVVRHLHTFARVSLDRLFFLRGRFEPFVVRSHGHEHLAALDAHGAGAILLGAHLGSFEAMRAASRKGALRLSVVVDSRSAERVGRVVRELSSNANLSVIPMEPDGLSTALRIRDAVRRGELVGILADRRAAEDDRNVTVDFLGAPAALPMGPFLLAHTLKCPVYQVFGVFSAPNQYDLYCEPFSDAVRLERGTRKDALRAYAQRYADRLAHHARLAPYNWFNLYDFWSEW
jgi:predicted LPLAT superfamily acyltransferase